jgi:hypothetical protein
VTALTELAAWIEDQLADELASRQHIAERALSGLRELAADLPAVLGALDHAEQLMRERAAAWCQECTADDSGACSQHLDDLDQADAYAALAARLGGAQ